MDVTINVNLTPKEARELMGLPDLQPLQDEALAEIRRRVMAKRKISRQMDCSRAGSWAIPAPLKSFAT
jgi:hypothetical protein